MTWRDTQIAVCRIQEKLLPLIGDILQVTPQAKNTTVQAAQILLYFKESPRYKEKIENLMDGPNSSQKLLEFITEILDDEKCIIPYSKEKKGVTVVKEALNKKMTHDMAQTLAGVFGEIPGTPDSEVLNHKLVKRYKDKGSPNLATMKKAEQALANANIKPKWLKGKVATNFKKEDILTVAMFMEQGEGVKHVKAKMEGTLKEVTHLNPFKYAQPKHQHWYERVKSDGPHEAQIQSKFNVNSINIFALIGGEAALEEAVQNALKTIERHDYRSNINENNTPNRANNVYHIKQSKAWRTRATKNLSQYIQNISESLKGVGFNAEDLDTATRLSNKTLTDVFTQKGVPSDQIPEIGTPQSTIEDTAEKTPNYTG